MIGHIPSTDTGSSSSPCAHRHRVLFSDHLQSPKAYSPKHRSHPARKPIARVRVDPSDPDQLCPARALYAPDTPETPETPAFDRSLARSILKQSSHPNALAGSLTEATRFNALGKKHTAALLDLAEPMNALSIKSALGPCKSFAALTDGALATLAKSLLSPFNVDFIAAPGTTQERDVEQAYSILYSKLRAWAASPLAATCSSEDSDALSAAMTTIGACLERDLEAVLQDNLPLSPQLPPSSSPSTSPIGNIILRSTQMPNPLQVSPNTNQQRATASGSSSPVAQANATAQKRGRSESEIRRARLTVDAAQSGLQCLAVLLHYPLYFERLGSRASLLLDKVLAVLHVPNFRQPKDREIVSFALYCLSSLNFPSATLEPFASRIADAVSDIYSKNVRWEKLRRSHMEALVAISKLGQRYPHLITPHILTKSLHNTTFYEALTASPHSARTRSVAALGGIAYGLWVNWTDRTPAGLTKRSDLIANLTQHMSSILRAGHANRFNKLWLLTEHKTDEAAWMLNSLAILPVLLGRRVTRPDAANFYKSCVAHITACFTHSSEIIRKVALIAWSHYIFANILAANSDGDKASLWQSGPVSVNAFQALAQIYRPSIKSTEAHIPSLEQSRYVVSVLYGLTNLVLASQLNDEDLFSRLNRIWQELIVSDLLNILQHPQTNAELVDLAMAVVHSMVGKPAEPVLFAPERLLAPGLMSGLFNLALTSDRIQESVQADWEAALKPADLPAWPSQWIVHHFDKAVDVLLACLDRAARIHETESPQSIDGYRCSDQPCPQVVANTWSGLVAHLKDSDASWHTAVTDQLLRVTDLLKRRIESPVVSRADAVKAAWCTELVNTAVEALLPLETTLPDFIFALKQLSPTWKIVQTLERLEQDTVVWQAELARLTESLIYEQASIDSIGRFPLLYQRTAVIWARHWRQESFSIPSSSAEDVAYIEQAFVNFLHLGMSKLVHHACLVITDGLCSGVLNENSHDMLQAFAIAPEASVSQVLRLLGLLWESLPESQAQEHQAVLSATIPTILMERAAANLELCHPLRAFCLRSCSTWPNGDSHWLLSSLVAALQKITCNERRGFWLEELHSLFLSLFDAHASSPAIQQVYAVVIASLQMALSTASAIDADLLNKWRPLIVSMWPTLPGQVTAQAQPLALVAFANLWHGTFGAAGVRPTEEDEQLRAILLAAHSSFPDLVPAAASPAEELPEEDNPDHEAPVRPMFEREGSASIDFESLWPSSLAAVNERPASPFEDSYEAEVSQMKCTAVGSKVPVGNLRRTLRKRKEPKTTWVASEQTQPSVEPVVKQVLRPAPVNTPQEQAKEQSPRARKRQRMECVEIVLRTDLPASTPSNLVSPRKRKHLEDQCSATRSHGRQRRLRKCHSEGDSGPEYVFPFQVSDDQRASLIVKGSSGDRKGARSAARRALKRAMDCLDQEESDEGC